MIAHILSSVFHSSELVITRANQNNQIGVPLNLLRINEKTKHVVLEIGMNTSGEIDRLAKKVKPNLVLITNAQRDHQEFLESVSITATKMEWLLKPSNRVELLSFPQILITRKFG